MDFWRVRLGDFEVELHGKDLIEREDEFKPVRVKFNDAGEEVELV